MVGDKISNLIITLKNAYTAEHSSVEVPFTKLTESIIEVLKSEKYVSDFSVKGEGKSKRIQVELNYSEGTPAITDVKRVSKQSRRVYTGYRDIRPVKQGYGISVISTPQGIMTGKQAKAKELGGEELFKVW